MNEASERLARTNHLRALLLLSIGAAGLTIGLKGTAYALTGSVGLLSDALESLMELPDTDLADWLTGRIPIPPGTATPMLLRIRASLPQ